MRQKLLTIATILLLALLAYSQWDRAITYREERDGYKEQLEAEQAKTKKLRAGVSAATSKAQDTRVRVKEAIDATPEFRDTPVPKSVADSLCKQIRCK